VIILLAYNVRITIFKLKGKTVQGVSHCYHRPRHLPDWSYNLFAMVHDKTADAAELQIQQIADLLGEHCRTHEVLYSTRILKKTGLRIK